MTGIHDADAAADDGLLVCFVSETEPRSEIDPAVIVDGPILRTPWAEVESHQTVGGRLQILVRDRNRPGRRDHVIRVEVVAQADVEHELRRNSPVILDEPADLVHPSLVRAVGAK